jgi:hypothetical protein
MSNRGDRIVLSITEEALDSIILADEATREARRRYRANTLRLESEGDFVRGVFLWAFGLFESFF